MVLGNITNQGIRITGTYPAIIVCLFTINFIFSFLFLELIPCLFKIKGASSFLSEEISQDPLENFLVSRGNKGEAMRIPQFPNLLKTHRVNK